MTTGRARRLGPKAHVLRVTYAVGRRPLRRNASPIISAGPSDGRLRILCASSCSTTACSVAYTSSSRDSEVVIESWLPSSRPEALVSWAPKPFWFERFTTLCPSDSEDSVRSTVLCLQSERPISIRQFRSSERRSGSDYGPFWNKKHTTSTVRQSRVPGLYTVGLRRPTILGVLRTFERL
jgi:hypothetical protein